MVDIFTIISPHRLDLSPQFHPNSIGRLSLSIVKRFYGSLMELLLLSAALSAERRTGSPLVILQTPAQIAQSPTILYFPDYVDVGEEWPVQLLAGNLDPT